MSELDEFLTDVDDADENVGYIKPNIEVGLSPKKRQECRDIVQEIKSFGVSQRQITYLIYLLALDLENHQLMKGITKLIGEERDNVALVATDKGQSPLSENEKTGEKKLILPT